MSYLVKLEKISKIYQLDAEDFVALRSIDFTLLEGEMLAVIGSSGSGKSTLMNIIGFLDQPSSGNYFFKGESIATLSHHALAEIRNQKIGFVFQSFFLLPRHTAIQNVMLPLFYRGTPTDVAKGRALAMLDKVGMARFVNHLPTQLSGGQQQRVAIARALVGEPEVILADEPTGALDTNTGNEIMQLFQKLNSDEGRSILLITHDPNISKRCQRVVQIQDGEILQS